MSSVRANKGRRRRICQGDVFRDIEWIEYVAEKGGVLEVSKIIFPAVAVLTQDCDLEWDSHARRKKPDERRDKKIFSVLAAPLYNAEHVFKGEHLLDLGLEMEPISRAKTPGKSLMQNSSPRYHYMEFPAEVPVVPSIVDFKHYFSISVEKLDKMRPKHFVCRLSALYREDLSQRFAAYLSRIALP